MYWDPPPDGTEDTATNFHCNRGDKLDVTMSYCSVCKHWDDHHSPGHNACQDTQGGASDIGGHSDTAVDSVGVGEDYDDEFTPFIG